jgi:hypothetical protein
MQRIMHDRLSGSQPAAAIPNAENKPPSPPCVCGQGCWRAQGARGVLLAPGSEFRLSPY